MFKLFLTFSLFVASFHYGLSQTKNFIDQPYIEVSGFSDTLVVPNLIYIKIVISEKDSRDRISVEDQELRMIDALKSLGIDTEKDLASSDMLSNYKFYLIKAKDILKSKEYILTVTTAELASKVFLKLEDIGVSNTSIQKVDHSNLEEFKNICRAKAIKNALAKAVAITEPISQKIGNAIHITDNDENIIHTLQGRVSGVQIRGYSSLESSKYEPPKIDFEKIRISSTINVKFVLK